MRAFLVGGAVLGMLWADAALAVPPPPGGVRPMPPIAGVPPAARPPGYGGWGYYGRPGWYGGGYRGWYGPAYGSWYGGWYGGWYGASWGPRVGVYLGAPWYGAGWAYPGFGYTWGAPYPYLWGAPYAYYYGVPVGVVATATAPAEAWEPAAPAAQAQPAPEAPRSYWYYCPQPQGYFPYVKDCAQGWMKVVPQVPGESASPPSLAR